MGSEESGSGDGIQEAGRCERGGGGYRTVFGFIGLVLPVSWGVMFALGVGRSPTATAVAMTCPMLVAALFLSLEGKAAWSAVGWRPPGWIYGAREPGERGLWNPLSGPSGPAGSPERHV